MSTLQRLMKMASKALDASGQSKSTGSGGTDWRDLVRTAADKVTGDAGTHPAPSRVQDAPAHNTPAQDVPVYGTPASTVPVQDAAPEQAASPEDRAAIARYDYLLKTAMPEQLEQVHRDAFGRLTPAQRQQVESRLRDELQATEQPVSSSPDDLARAAVRGEAHKPGFLRRVFSKPGAAGAAGVGVGAVAGAGIGMAGGLLAAVAGGAVLSSVAGPLLEQASGMGIDFDALGGLEGGIENGIGDVASGVGEHASGLGDHVSELGSNFEIPGLGDLGSLFGRD
jgi:hypothetical protein